MNILIVEKLGTIKQTNVKSPDDIYKKCGFKTDKDFLLRTMWDAIWDSVDIKIALFAKDTGRANSENKYEFPPPVDNELYFGSVALVAFSKDEEIIDLTIEMWESIYEALYGGFENLDDYDNDSNETDELDDIPDDMKTKEGYLKDGFVVPDNELLDDIDMVEYEEDELEDDENSELDEEEYLYSDEEL